MTTVLKIAGLNVAFDTGIERVNALNDVSISIKKGEVLGIIGASGSGKSTMLKVLVGLTSSNQISTGKVCYSILDNSNLLTWDNSSWQSFRKNEIGILFQNALQNLNPSKRILAHFKSIYRLKNKTWNKRSAYEFLSKVQFTNDLDLILKSFPHQLSGGQQQRVLLALMLAQETKILLLDEPFSSLDYWSQEGIVKLLKKLIRSEDLTVLLASHDLDVIQRLSDQIIVFENGKIVESGSADVVLQDPKHIFTKSLIEAQKLDFKKSDLDSKEEVLVMKDVDHSYDKASFFSFQKVSLQVLEKFNLKLYRGEILGIVGRSGSGKTTIVNLLLGNLILQKGRIVINGIPLNNVIGNDRKALSKEIVLIPQNSDDAFDPKMLIKDMLNMVWNAQYLKNEKTKASVIRNLLQELELEENLLHRYPSELSGGQIQRMAILRALLVRPSILVFDESLTALDMIVQRQILLLIHRLNQKLNISVILISHDRRVVEAISHRIINLT